jgi:DNA-binding LacI/PurR family transcriptional regulator
MILVVVPYLHNGAFFAGIVSSIDAELSAQGYTSSLDGIEDKVRRLVQRG